MTRELNVIDKAIVVDVLIDGDGWARRCAGARAVVEQGVIAALCGVACRVSDGGGDRDGGAGSRRIEADVDAIIEHGLGHGACEQGIAVLVGDGDGVTYYGARA